MKISARCIATSGQGIVMTTIHTKAYHAPKILLMIGHMVLALILLLRNLYTAMVPPVLTYQQLWVGKFKFMMTEKWSR